MAKINSTDNLIVIIPAYEPPKEFISYAQEVSKICKKLIVVNDGSKADYNGVFEEISKLKNVVYLTYDCNHGKGYALRTAYKYCVENFNEEDIIVTADCDGQHKIKDVLNVYKASNNHKDAYMLGSRDMNAKNVPKRSRAGNTQIKRLFRLFYGIKLYDSQTGLRGHSVKTAGELLKVKGNRFEYEHATLIYAKKHHIDILETPIETVYPENVKDHVSHFKTFSDSMKVMGVMFKNLGVYFISSALSAILDVLIFYLLARVVLKDVSAVNTLIATVSARVMSSILNFILNFKYVFNGMSKRSVYRYYILWLCQLGASYVIVFLFGNLIGLNLTVTKVVGDLCLALLSYQIQQKWVFKNKDNKQFRGGFAKFALKLGRSFTKEYRCDVLPYDEGVVYVCRHLNMHGPYSTLKWLNFDVHPMVLSNFCNTKDCYRQLANYTFTEREGKKKRKFNLKAFLVSRVIAKSVKSLKPVPVYRKSTESIITFKKALECLINNQSLIIYPDIDYQAKKDVKSDIYDGFLFLGELYYKKTGKELKFIPISIDDENKKLIEREEVVVNDYKKDCQLAKRKLIDRINM